jgi:YesN/AraC family two-component response regulator
MNGLKELKGNEILFDLVITDLAMPLVGGIEVVSLLKKISQNPNH